MTAQEVIERAKAEALTELAEFLTIGHCRDSHEDGVECDDCEYNSCPQCDFELERSGILVGCGHLCCCPHGSDWMEDALADVWIPIAERIEKELAESLGLRQVSSSEWSDQQSGIGIALTFNEPASYVAYFTENGEDIPGTERETMEDTLYAAREWMSS